MFKTLEELIVVIRQRKGSSPEKSYTNKLLNDKKLITEKVKEEIAELKELILKSSTSTSKYIFSISIKFATRDSPFQKIP